jgi:hypothetical protein
LECGVLFLGKQLQHQFFFSSQKTVTAKVYQKINEQLITLLEEDEWYCWLQ